MAPGGSGKRDVLRPQADAGRKNGGAGGDVLASAADVVTRTRDMVDDNAHGAVGAAFLHDDSVGAGGDRGAGEDACGSSRLQRRPQRAGRDALADRQADAGGGDVGCAHGIAVHRRIVERRHGHVRLLRQGQNAAGSGSQRQRACFRDRLRRGQQFFQGLFVTQHARSCSWRWLMTKAAMAATSFSGSRGRPLAISASLATATMSLRSGNNGGLPFSGR